MSELSPTRAAAVDLAAAVPPEERLALENAQLRVTLWPRMGGKVVSLIAKAESGDHELLHPPLHAYTTASDSSGFELSDAGGWDECLPSVAACTAHGAMIPDHGDVWRRPWRASSDGTSLTASVDAFSVPVHFSKRLSLSNSTLLTEYSAQNPTAHVAEFLWSAHPLFQVEEGDRIVLPGNVADVHVEGSTINSLAREDGRCAWPMADSSAGSWIDLSQVGPLDGTTAHKLFAGPLTNGWCGLYRSKLQLGILVQFDPRLTPYAGLWISHGQWPAGGKHRQYTVALEPTFAPCDALDKASITGRSMVLAPGRTFSWPLHLSVAQSVTYESFLAAAQASAGSFTLDH